MKDLVSVIMPVFNGAKYIRSMLESIMRQTYRPLQIVLYNDASSDNSMEIIENWSKEQTDKDVKIEIYSSEKNEGLRRTTSKAVLLAEGKYIFLADQDDIWLSRKIEAQVNYMERNADCMVCFCRRKVIDADGKILMPYENIEEPVYMKKMGIAEVISKPACFPANCMCLRNCHLDKIFPVHNMYSEHDSFITIMAAHFGQVVLLRDTLVEYRIHGKNSSHAYFVEMSGNPIAVLKIKIAQLKNAKKTYQRDEEILKEVLNRRFQEDYMEISQGYHREPVKNVYFCGLTWLFKILVSGNLNKFSRKSI